MKLAGVFVFCWTGCVSLNGCAALSASINRQVIADKTALENNFKREIISTSSFQLTVFSKIKEPTRPLHVYIEGDGFAWASRTQLSDDPTPFNPVALYLAAKDPAENVVYLARPCQYTPFSMDGECRPEYWSDSRFSEVVVSSMNEAVNQLKQTSGSKEIHLVGYSGGAAIAALLAARRNDIASLRTVAGNLDPEMVNRHHGVNSLEGSLNPSDVAEKLSVIPQRHFVGAKDQIIPRSIVDSFVDRMKNSPCIKTTTVEQATHSHGWQEVWSALMAMPVACEEE